MIWRISDPFIQEHFLYTSMTIKMNAFIFTNQMNEKDLFQTAAFQSLLEMGYTKEQIVKAYEQIENKGYSLLSMYY